MSFAHTRWVWLNGRLVAWNEAKIHSSAHGLHYGTGVFEGTRCYATDRGPAIFRLDAHLDRLFASAEIYGMAIPFTREELRQATLDVVTRNGFGDSYLRHLCFLDTGSLGIRAACPVGVVIVAWPWESVYSAMDLERGIRVTVSPWQKFSSAMMPTTAKASGQYLNSRLAVTEAAKRGFDEAILLDVNGNVAEASVANVFLVRDGRLVTNDERSSILPGITRATVIELARDSGYPVEIDRMRVGDLLTADEAFLTGTAAEIVPLRELDGKPLGMGSRGPVTALLQAAYQRVTSGQDARHEKWLEFAVNDERFDLATIA